MSELYVFIGGFSLTLLVGLYFMARIEGEVNLEGVAQMALFSSMWFVSVPLYAILWGLLCGEDVKLWVRKQAPPEPIKPLLLPAPSDSHE